MEAGEMLAFPNLVQTVAALLKRHECSPQLLILQYKLARLGCTLQPLHVPLKQASLQIQVW